jgi:hypothetical protein
MRLTWLGCGACRSKIGIHDSYINQSIVHEIDCPRILKALTMKDDIRCPRVMTKAEMIEMLQAGMTLVVDRIDAPELPELREMEREGLVVSRPVEVDEQYSCLKFRWKGEGP